MRRRMQATEHAAMTIAPAPQSVARQTAIGAGWIIAWRVATRNIGLVSTLILVRLLQPADFGLVALATGFINAADALSAIGVQDALIRLPKLDRNLYDTGFGLSVARGFLTALVIVAIAWPLGNFFSDERLTIVLLALSTSSVISGFENIGIVDFRRDLAFRKEFALQLWSRVIGAGTTIAVAAVWHSYWALVAGILVYRLVRLIQSYLMSPYRPRVTLVSWRQIIGFSLWTWGQAMLNQARDRIDSIVIGRLLGTFQVGVFSVGVELGLLPTTELVEPLGRAQFSGLAALRNASEGLGSLFVGAVGLGMLIVLPAGFGISMLADPMVRLSLGEQWLAAVPVIQILAIGGTFTIVTYSCGNVLNVIGRPHVNFYVGIISLSTKLVALLILVTPYHLAGAAIGLTIASAVDLVLLLCVTLPKIGVSVWQLCASIGRPAIGTLAMVMVLWQLEMAWTPSEGADALHFAQDAAVRAAIGATCYAIAVIALWWAGGRPDGAERFVLNIAAGALRRFRRF